MSIPRTVTALKRWSCQDKQLPQVNQIQAIHVYDFDNTCMCAVLVCERALRLIQSSILLSTSEQAALERWHLRPTAGPRLPPWRHRRLVA